MAEKDFNIELLREDLGIPYVVNLNNKNLVEGIVGSILITDEYHKWETEVKAGNFLKEYPDDEKFCLLPKNEELKEIIGDLSTLSKADCFRDGMEHITESYIGRSSQMEDKDYFDLCKTEALNNKVDAKLKEFYNAVCDNNTLAMSYPLKELTSMTVMHKYLESKIIDNVFVNAFAKQMEISNKDLLYAPRNVKFRDEKLEVKMNEEMTPKFKELKELKEKLLCKDELKDLFKNYDRKGLEKHMKGEMPYQKEIITNLRNKIKEMETIRTKYIKEDTKHIEKARASLINRYQIKRDSVEQSTEMKM